MENALTLHCPSLQKGFAGGKVSLRDCFSLFTKEEELELENAPVCGLHRGTVGWRSWWAPYGHGVARCFRVGNACLGLCRGLRCTLDS